MGFGMILLAVGLALAGWFIGNGVREIRTADRFVSVKGVSEREAKADLALWPIQLAVPDADLAAAQSRVNQNVAKVVAFLRANGIDSTEVELQGLRVTDTFANPYNQGARQGARFVIQQTVMVRSELPRSSAPRVRKSATSLTRASFSPLAPSGDPAGPPTSSGG